ncbi:MAG TPA: CCA tRNA nucleotidyltransferase [Bacteroidia bacterium]|nr:CCA tRNA nucleotidyltransferase [Bacteroidia bacterium]
MRKAATQIVLELRAAGHEACFAGGCVRDLLRGAEPKDYDIATSARPDEVLKLYPKADSVGAHFGVILVRRGGHHFEIATFREDGEYRDGRRPESVTFTTAEDDARRRDFTINGMFYDPAEERVIDHVGGRADLEAGKIRAIGDPRERFREDYLRLLRAIRFATVLGFEIEADTWEAIRDVAGRIVKISPERIRDELDKIWRSPNRLKGFDLLVGSGLMEAILPEILALRGCEQPPQFHPEGDVFVHTRLMLSLLPADADLPLVLSVLLHDIAKPDTFSLDPAEGRIRFNGHEKVGAEKAAVILKRLRYPNATIDAVVSGVAHHMQFKDVQKMRTATLKRFMARERFDEELELHRVDCLGSNGRLENHAYLVEKREQFANAPLPTSWFLSGADLIAQGISPGPALGRVLTEAHDLQLDGTLTSREEALEWLARQNDEGTAS